MSKAEYWQRGEAIDYVNETEETIEANQIVVFGSRVGIAGAPIEPGETGALHVFGVFEFPKASGEEIAAGTTVYYDGSAEAVTASGSSASAEETGSDDEEASATSDEAESTGETIEIGYATEAAAADDTTVKVKLLG